jgi:hypothetical protein
MSWIIPYYPIFWQEAIYFLHEGKSNPQFVTLNEVKGLYGWH